MLCHVNLHTKYWPLLLSLKQFDYHKTMRIFSFILIIPILQGTFKFSKFAWMPTCSDQKWTCCLHASYNLQLVLRQNIIYFWKAFKLAIVRRNGTTVYRATVTVVWVYFARLLEGPVDCITTAFEQKGPRLNDSYSFKWINIIVQWKLLHL